MRAYSSRTVKLVLLLVLSIVAIAVIWITRDSEIEPVPTATPAPVQTVYYATVLPTPASIGESILFPENEMANFAYCEDCYPHIAALYPPETPCATWENGGLQWANLDDRTDMKLGWSAVVWQGPRRFCGFPSPYPDQPAEPPEPEVPDDWLDWTIAATARARVVTPEPTESP